MRRNSDLKKIAVCAEKMAVAYCDGRKHFLLEEMAEVCPKLK